MKRHLLNYSMKYPITSFNTFGILYKSGLIFCWCRQECSGVLPSEETEIMPCPFVKRIIYLIIQILSSQFPKSNTKIPRNFFLLKLTLKPEILLWLFYWFQLSGVTSSFKAFVRKSATPSAKNAFCKSIKEMLKGKAWFDADCLWRIFWGLW